MAHSGESQAQEAEAAEGRLPALQAVEAPCCEEGGPREGRARLAAARSRRLVAAPGSTGAGVHMLAPPRAGPGSRSMFEQATSLLPHWLSRCIPLRQLLPEVRPPGRAGCCCLRPWSAPPVLAQAARCARATSSRLALGRLLAPSGAASTHPARTSRAGASGPGDQSPKDLPAPTDRGVPYAILGSQGCKGIALRRPRSLLAGAVRISEAVSARFCFAWNGMTAGASRTGEGASATLTRTAVGNCCSEREETRRELCRNRLGLSARCLVLAG